MKQNNILEIEKLEVQYGVIKVLKKIDITVREGEIVCLIGANGAGKSTLLKAITGLIPISSGSISYKGETIIDEKKALSTDKITALGISLVPEGRQIFGDMTVLENLELGAFLKKDRRYIKGKLEEIFVYFPILKDRRNQKASSLSGGEQQMLAVGRALMSSPTLLLMDEPGLGLAPMVIKEIFEIIHRINKDDGITIFLVEQNARLALKASQHGYVMETGRIVLHDKSERLIQDPIVKKAYLGE